MSKISTARVSQRGASTHKSINCHAAAHNEVAADGAIVKALAQSTHAAEGHRVVVRAGASGLQGKAVTGKVNLNAVATKGDREALIV